MYHHWDTNNRAMKSLRNVVIDAMPFLAKRLLWKLFSILYLNVASLPNVAIVY